MQKLLQISVFALVCIWLFMLTGCSQQAFIAESTAETIYSGGNYIDYSPDLIWSDDDVVLFFHADRCSTCEQARKSFELTGIPAWLTILEVDYDTETQLKQKYSILTQTSYVYIDSDWELLKRRVWGRHIDDIIAKIDQVKTGELKPREKVLQEKITNEDTVVIWGNDDTAIAQAYFAWGCFWCIEWPMEATPWVLEAISGYIWWSDADANYDDVSKGKTRHRESVKVIYNPNEVSYAQLLEVYRQQIDPTDDWGQFADRWYQYTTAIYTTNEAQTIEATSQKNALQDSGRFDEDIAVVIEEFDTFYPAEEYHQDYYKKNNAHYERYAAWSGRKWYIQNTRTSRTQQIFWNNEPDENSETFEEVVDWDIMLDTSDTITQDTDTQKLWSILPVKKIGELTDLQREILFEGGTERPFDNEYRDNKEEGIYVDALDGTPLFSSTDKFDSWTWRPSFSKPIAMDEVEEDTDTSYGMIRTEVKSSSSDGHLWHIFDDGPAELWGQRYCINSAALVFVPLADMQDMGYGEFMNLFE